MSVTQNENNQGGADAVPVYLVQIPPDPEDLQDDLFRLFGFLRHYRTLIAVSILLFTIPAAIYALVADPVYRAEVLVAPVQTGDAPGGLSALASQFGGLASLAGVSIGGAAEKDQAIAVLISRAFTDSFIEQHGLITVLFADDWDAESGEWRFDDISDHPTKRDAYEKFNNDVRRVREDSVTGLVTLTIDWHDRELAAAWANALIQRLNDHLREIAIEEANKSIAYLEEELESTSVLELRQAVFRLIEQQIELAMFANTRKEFALKVLDPAVVPDEDDHVWPIRAVIVILGAVFGGLMGLAFALVLRAISGSD